MAILLNNDGGRHEDWKRCLRALLPEQDVLELSDVTDPSDIEYAIVWNHPKGDLARYSNLKAVLSTGAGTEHFDADPDLPNVPIIRLVDMAMAEDMALYTLYWVLHFQRDFETYRRQEGEAVWRRYPSPMAQDYQLCILGLGAIGRVIAQRLSSAGFNVKGWSRSPKDIDGVKSIAGETELINTLGHTDVLINCLPLNEQTRGFLNHARLSKLRKGANIINISRGPIIEDTALLKLLDDGHIAEAALDVFETEPLPKSSPYWNHPNVHVTPHMSGATNPETAAKIIVENIKILESGGIPDHLYVRSGGVS